LTKTKGKKKKVKSKMENGYEIFEGLAKAKGLTQLGKKPKKDKKEK
jgi:hypothetical protein